MLNKLKDVFKSSKVKEEEAYLLEHAIQFDQQQGYIVDGIVLNQELAERLEYFSNRRLNKFDDLQALYYAAMLINEKIDLEITQQRFVARLGNTEENLRQFKNIVKKLNDYYRSFIREK
ncbi:hypothetical protein [Acinetobacter sp. ANC 4178]|uniref:hypothetical protein n=1 Tax=Acinetobacter sp. ANC 4178 TaxID=2529839 RepID=UPI00103D4F13|nr:hypothetical protein [Acinetobacter sp. ANC 4178]TCB68407.1 hypothetical protein E0H87_00215 [Acinetobacter sp. ANC 4178]